MMIMMTAVMASFYMIIIIIISTIAGETNGLKEGIIESRIWKKVYICLLPFVRHSRRTSNKFDSIIWYDEYKQRRQY